MPLEHLHFLSVLKTDDVILRNGFRDRYRRFGAGRRFIRRILDRHECAMNILDQCRQCCGRNCIMGSMCRYDLRGKGKDVVPLLEFGQDFLRDLLNIRNMGVVEIIFQRNATIIFQNSRNI